MVLTQMTGDVQCLYLILLKQLMSGEEECQHKETELHDNGFFNFYFCNLSSYFCNQSIEKFHKLYFEFCLISAIQQKPWKI